MTECEGAYSIELSHMKLKKKHITTISFQEDNLTNHRLYIYPCLISMSKLNCDSTAYIPKYIFVYLKNAYFRQ